MFKSIIIFSLKRILRYNTYSLINILGLAVGLASFILIALYVYDEYSYDRYHSKSNRIYRVVSELELGGIGEKSSSQPFPMGPAFQESYPEYIEASVRFFNQQKSQFLVVNGNKVFNEKRFFYSDANVFKVFDFKLIQGDPNKVLKKPFSIVITQSMAKKYFEDVDPIGKKLLVDNYFEYEVTGVAEDVKAQSHFKFDFLASFSSLAYLFKSERMLNDWVWNPCWTYLLLKEDKSALQLETKINEFVKRQNQVIWNDNSKLILQPLKDIHLKSNLAYEIEKNGNFKNINFLTILAVVIIILGLINYINLATANSSGRSKEIGMRKVSGAGKRQLFFQFIIESLLLTLISLLVAISLVELFLPLFSTITGKTIPTGFRFKRETLMGIFCLWFFTGFIAGLYPATFLSSFQSTNLLRKDFKFGTRSANFRKSLVFIQFAISVILIIATFGVFRQLRYLHNADLGFKKNDIVIINAGSEVSWNYPKFKEELLKNKNIKHVTGMNYIIGSSHNSYAFIPENSTKNEFTYFPALFVRDDFVKTFQIQLLSGRDFIENENNAGEELLVNEEMVKYLGYKKNEDLLGKYFFNGQRNEKVVGIYSNINVTSLHYQVEPFIIKMFKDSIARNVGTEYIVIQIDKNNIAESIASIEKTWERMCFDRPFEYRFLQDILDAHYSGEDILGDLSRIFTILSIVIALLGIWGLTAYITEQRTREIGIRKTLGASLFDIVTLINKEFFLIVLVANLIAWPVAYYALNNWIKSFAYRDFLTIWSFLLASAIAILIALLTISHKATEAGRRNPVDAIRYE